jgi:hypothetical protein
MRGLVQAQRIGRDKRSKANDADLEVVGMVSCADYFQGLLDYLSAPEADPTKYHRLSATIAGNRQESNLFVSYISVYSLKYSPGVVVGQVLVQPAILSGEGTEYFSDRVVPYEKTDPSPMQPFDAGQADRISVSLRLPNGPLQFTSEQGGLSAQFSTLQCTDSGLVVCTSDFDRSMILVSFREELGLILQGN